VPSTNLLFSEIKERLNDQLQSIDSLDTKAGITLGFIGVILAGLVNSAWFLDLPYYYLLIILTLIFLTTFFILRAYLVKSYRKDPDPKALVDKYENENEDKIKKQLIRNFEECFNKNKKSLEDKKDNLNLGFTFLFVTVIALGIIVFLSNQNIILDKSSKYKFHHKWGVVKYDRP